LLQRIKAHDELRKIPVLVFSSSDADTDIHDAYSNHANGYITKPASFEVLTQIVKTIEQFWIEVAKLPKVLR
jgi:DNA-binding NarL/FixJ family response regulator